MIPKYRVKELSLIGNTLVPAGEIVEYDGLPAENLEPQCKVGEARYAEYLRSNNERIERMKAEFPSTDPAEKLADVIAAAMKKSGAAQA